MAFDCKCYTKIIEPSQPAIKLKIEDLPGNGRQLSDAEAQKEMLELKADVEQMKAWKEEMDLWMEHRVKVFRGQRE